MKRSALAATVALVLAGFCATAASSESSYAWESTHHRDPVPAHCKIGPFRAFSAAVWAVERWRRGNPPERVIAALERRISCAPPGHRRAMLRTWKRDRGAFFAHRKAMLWRERVTPYRAPDGRYFALPWSIVYCESSGRGYITSGYYGILVSTWEAFGGTAFAPVPGDAPKKAQDIVAHKLLMRYGLQPWECASIVGLL